MNRDLWTLEGLNLGQCSSLAQNGGMNDERDWSGHQEMARYHEK